MNIDWTSIPNEEQVEIINFINNEYGYAFKQVNLNSRKATLSFFPKHDFVEFTILPQTIETSSPRKIIIREKMIFLCLYNHSTKSSKNKFFAFNSHSLVVYQINKKLNVKISKDNVLEYIKFYGYVVRYNFQPFIFITNLNEIHWKENIVEKDKERLLGAINSYSTITDNKELAIEIETSKSFLLGEVFTFTIPCIWSHKCYSAKVRVNNKGIPDLTEENSLYEDDLLGLDEPPPFFNLETGLKEEGLGSQVNKLKTRSQKFLGFIFLVISPLIWSFASLLILCIVDLYFNLSGNLASSEKLNSFLTSNSIYIFCCFLFSVIYIIWEAYKMIIIILSKIISKQAPGYLNFIYLKFRSQITKYEYTKGKRWVLIIRTLFITITASIFIWCISMYSLNKLFGLIFTNQESISLAETFIFVIRGITIGFIPGVLNVFNVDISNYSTSLSDFGELLINLLRFYIIFIIVRYVKVIWKAKPFQMPELGEN